MIPTQPKGYSGFNERYDCVLRAFAILLDMSYSDVHAEFKALGRKSRCRTWHKTELAFAENHDLTMNTLKPRRTVRNFLNDVAYIPVLAACVRGHMFAVKYGQITDIEAVRATKHVQYFYTRSRPWPQK